MTEFDRYREGYQGRVDDVVAFSGAEQQFFLQEKADHIARLARERLSEAPAVLDVGCGIGLVQRLLADLSPRIFGVDVAPETLREAKAESPGGRFVRYDGAGLPFADGSFDLVFAVCVMHHVPPAHWSEFAAELARVARPGGLVAIFEHNPLNPLTRVVVNRCELDEHAVLLGPRRVRHLLEEAGLGDVDQRHILFFPWSGRLWRSVEASLGWLPLGAQYYVAATKPAGASA